MTTAVQGYSPNEVKFWRITVGLALASFFVFASLYSVQPILPLFVEEFKITPTVSSLSLSLTVLTLAIGLVIFGFYSDRIGRVRIIQLSLAGSILPFILTPLTDSFAIILILRFLQGFALAGLPAAAVAYIGEEINKENTGFAVALYISSNALGGMVGRALTGYVAFHYSWRMSFYFFAGVGLLIFFINLFALPRSRFFQVSNASFMNDVKGLFSHLKNFLLIPAFILGLVLQVSFTGVWTYLPFYLQKPPLSLSIGVISFFYLTYIFGVVGAPLGGYLAKRFTLKPVMISGIFVLSLGIFLSIFSSVVIITIALSLICFGFFIAHSMAAAWVSQQAIHHKGGASGLYLQSYYIGVATGGTMLGVVWGLFDWVGIVILTMMLPLVAYGLFWTKMSVFKRAED